MNSAIMLKSNFIWDKYALPLLVVFWYMKSINALDEEEPTSIKCQAGELSGLTLRAFKS